MTLCRGCPWASVLKETVNLAHGKTRDCPWPNSGDRGGGGLVVSESVPKLNFRVSAPHPIPPGVEREEAVHRKKRGGG